MRISVSNGLSTRSWEGNDEKRQKFEKVPREFQLGNFLLSFQQITSAPHEEERNTHNAGSFPSVLEFLSGSKPFVRFLYVWCSGFLVSFVLHFTKKSPWLSGSNLRIVQNSDNPAVAETWLPETVTLWQRKEGRVRKCILLRAPVAPRHEEPIGRWA